MGDISERLLFLVKKHAKGKATVFAKNAGIPPSTFQYYINDRMPHGEHLKRICETFNVNLNWLLIGKGEPYLSSTAVKEGTGDKEAQVSQERSPNNFEINDAEIIQRFSDKRYAKELNSSLVELEQLNQEAFKKVGPYIKGLLDGLRIPRSGCKYTSLERRVAKRRVKDDPKKFKGEKDRRSGKDRRVAAQR